MSARRYTEDHEWIELDDHGIATVGITDYAQEQLGDVVFVELPEIGESFDQGADAAVVESVKAAADVKMPVAGSVTATNGALLDSPSLINESPESEGWFLKITPADPEQLDDLMDGDAYSTYLSDLKG